MKTMKLMYLVILLFIGSAIAVGQKSDQRIRTVGGSLNHRDKTIVNLGIDRSVANETAAAANTAGVATNVIGIANLEANQDLDSIRIDTLELSFQSTATVREINVLVTVDSSQIVGTDAGDIGHVDGAILVAAPTSDYVLEFVSATFIYDYGVSAFAGGANDIVVQVGGSGTQVALSSAITDANLLTAAGDKIVRLGPIDTEVLPLVGGALSIAGTALTDVAATARGALRVHLTYRRHTTGL